MITFRFTKTKHAGLSSPCCMLGWTYCMSLVNAGEEQSGNYSSYSLWGRPIAVLTGGSKELSFWRSRIHNSLLSKDSSLWIPRTWALWSDMRSWPNRQGFLKRQKDLCVNWDVKTHSTDFLTLQFKLMIVILHEGIFPGFICIFHSGFYVCM